MKKCLSVLVLCFGVLACASAQRYDRGYTSTPQKVFVPKGSFMVAGTGKVTWHREDNYNFLMIDGINADGYSVNLSPTFLYMPWNNIGVGFRVGYDRMKLNINSAELDVSEIKINVDDYFRLTQSIEAAAIFRPYIPLGNSGRFSIFAQVELGFSGGKVKNTALVSPEVKGTYTEKYKFLVGVNPGITALLTNHFALEVSVGVLGFNYNWNNMVHNQIEYGSDSVANASFMLNLATISISLAYYL
ncbi:MAG: hypothetical protein ACI39U_07420 [Candidatus Cryptobacteroides sp.]